MLKEENNPDKGRERWAMEGSGVSWDFPSQMTFWYGKHLSHSLSIFSYVSKEKIVFSLAFFFVLSCFSTMFR